MSVESRVRKIYERRPYPPRALRGEDRKWSLPPLEWINAVREKREELSPRRILVAGCGVGTEAFAVARQFPSAEVVAVDFSERSITVARRLQRFADGGQRVRFEVADIASPALLEIAGDRFDLITCHGVLSYVPGTASVLRNLARALTPAGILILGTNGAAHPSVRFRPVLPLLGIASDEFREGRRVREALRVCDSLSVYPPTPIAALPAGYLAGDLFGPLNRALSLAEWKVFYGDAGLHLLGSYHAFFAVRPLLNGDLHPVLMPRSRAGVAELVDALQPASFHQLVLARRPATKTPWHGARNVLRCRPMRTALYTFRWPRGRARWNELRNVRLESRATMTGVTLSVPQWEVEILKNCDGTRSLRDLLRPVRSTIPARTVSEAMYVLYQLTAINLLPGAE